MMPRMGRLLLLGTVSSHQLLQGRALLLGTSRSMAPQAPCGLTQSWFSLLDSIAAPWGACELPLRRPCPWLAAVSQQ